GNRSDLAIGQDHARDRRVAKLAGPGTHLGMQLRCCEHLLAQVGGGVDQEPVFAVGTDGNRGLGAPEFGMIVSRGPADQASTVPLWNTAARRRAQDDDAKHDPSPGTVSGTPGKYKGGLRLACVRAFEGRISPEGPPASTEEIVAADYLRAAQAYMLISMPTGTSTIFGAFQAIMALLLETEQTDGNWTNLRPVH